MPTWNFSSNVLASLAGESRGLVALSRDGSRSEWTFAEVDAVSSRFAGALRERGVRKGDVVLTFMGNTAEWVFTLTACWRIGAVAMPCNVQLTPHDLSKRIALAAPKIAGIAPKTRPTVEQANFDGPVVEGCHPPMRGTAAPDEPLEPDD